MIQSDEQQAPESRPLHRVDKIETSLTSNMRGEAIFCDLGTTALQAFERIKIVGTYPKNAVLFLEGQAPCGIFVLGRGQVRLSICTGDGKRFVLRHSQPGDVLGLSATVSGKPYEFTAEAVEQCQINFVKREDIRFLKDNADACFKASSSVSTSIVRLRSGDLLKGAKRP